MRSHGERTVSFILATHNRAAVVHHTLRQLGSCLPSRLDYEVIVVDNASTDGTPDLIQSNCDLLIRSTRNRGSCAKALGTARARGRYIVFLDDDSYPRADCIPRMIEHFEADRHLGAAGMTVHLTDGRMEGGALPDVFLGCGVGFRWEALHSAGGLDISFFMQAEEYDLAFRLAGAGWGVRMFDDLHVDHQKTPCSRQSDRTVYYDIRNNLRVMARYLPPSAYRPYRDDTLQRYARLAERSGHRSAYARGARAGRWHAFRERFHYRRRRLNAESFERFFAWETIRSRFSDLASAGTRRVVFADLGKNVYAYYRAAGMTGIKVPAIGDDRFAAAKRKYRGIPVVAGDEALALEVDAVVVANSSPVHGTVTHRRVRTRTDLPVHHWFFPHDHESQNYGTTSSDVDPVGRQGRVLASA